VIWDRFVRFPGIQSRNDERAQNLGDALDNISQLLRAWSDGDQLALGELTPIVYAERRRLAHGYSDGSAPTTASKQPPWSMKPAVQVVERRFFGGLSVEETAVVLKVSPVTVGRDWSSAKMWLYRELTGETDDELESLETAR
jgi:hypothetical protein